MDAPTKIYAKCWNEESGFSLNGQWHLKDSWASPPQMEQKCRVTSCLNFSLHQTVYACYEDYSNKRLRVAYSSLYNVDTGKFFSSVCLNPSAVLDNQLLHFLSWYIIMIVKLHQGLPYAVLSVCLSVSLSASPGLTSSLLLLTLLVFHFDFSAVGPSAWNDHRFQVLHLS